MHNTKNIRQLLDDAALAGAMRTHKKAHAIKNGGVTQSWSELLYINRADFTAYASSAVEGSLVAGLNLQPVIPAFYFTQGGMGFGRSVRVTCEGILGSTGTPTYTFQFRLGTTAGSSFLSGTSVGVSAAITTGSGVSNKYWRAEMVYTCNTPGIGTTNATLNCSGYIASYSGFASPFHYPLLPTTPDTATWTATLDAGLTQYLNVSVTASASSASNTVTLKRLMVEGLN